MNRSPWNHNIHYHGLVIDAVPPNCLRALDVGCGDGLLARQLTRHSKEVIGIDIDSECLSRARTAGAGDGQITFLQGDVLAHEFPCESFNFITAVATLHHLPLSPALRRFRELLKPGGVIAIVGLYRASTLEDYALAAVALPASWLFRCIRHHTTVLAPVKEPKESLLQIRACCETVLPGAAFRRHLLFRYSLIWRKPVL
jgi:2-polyprenyl-3-methyl-5-hydroxy-6-metoxy-1,4-benzoquinol methylase